jgi:hypothetical protein
MLLQLLPELEWKQLSRWTCPTLIEPLRGWHPEDTQIGLSACPLPTFPELFHQS